MRTFLRTALLLGAGLCAGAAARSGPEHRAFRPLAMGNAFVAVVDDKDALYYNPAGLNLINSLGNPSSRPPLSAYPRQRFNARMNLVGVAAPLADGLRLMRFYREHEESLGDPDSLRTDESLYPDMIPLSRKPIRVGVLHSSEYAMHNFGAAYWADAQVAPYSDDGLLLPQAGIESMQIDAVIQVAGARSFVNHRLSVGVGYRLANRQQVRNFSVAASEFADNGGKKVKDAVLDTLKEKMANLRDVTSYGHGLDAGLLWQQNPWLRLGAAAQNVGMYLDGKPVTPEITVGLAVTPRGLCRAGRFSRKVNFALDFEDLLDGERNYRPAGKVNLGAEIEQNITWMLGVRAAAGLKGGYWSAGAGLSFFRALHLEAVSWAEEAGYYTGHIEERYYALNIALGL
ncbi:MAG: hypothetical protein K0Q91_2146 [Fibrobacteria bacterium]|nr:hypothetical protein [Fibrobacteria bacterium]